MLQTLPRQSNTMQNTFKILEVNNSDVCWGEELLLSFAAHRLIELKDRYPHLDFVIAPHTQIVRNFS
jgi:hypothetical protein